MTAPYHYLISNAGRIVSLGFVSVLAAAGDASRYDECFLMLKIISTADNLTKQY